MCLWASNLGEGLSLVPNFSLQKKMSWETLNSRNKKILTPKNPRLQNLSPFFCIFGKKGWQPHRFWQLDFLGPKAMPPPRWPTRFGGWWLASADTRLGFGQISSRKPVTDGPFWGAFRGWFERWPSNGRVYIYIYAVNIYTQMYMFIYTYLLGSRRFIYDSRYYVTYKCIYRHKVVWFSAFGEDIFGIQYP